MVTQCGQSYGFLAVMKGERDNSLNYGFILMIIFLLLRSF